MKVSMIPDNSVKMIHASQDDVGRRWEFELYDEDGLIDVSSAGEQMFYPVYSGGTEQILPENTSTPTTSPLIADIVYPDEERDDQEFLYRECPSAEDGNARIKKIVGNTVKFNQLMRNGNFADTSVWSNGATYISGGKLTLPNRTTGGDSYSVQDYIPFILNHKYYCSVYAKTVDPSGQTGYPYVQINAIGVSRINIASSNIQRYSGVGVCDRSDTKRILLQNDHGYGAEFSYVMLFDMTAMGKENYTAEQFEAWLSAFYPLPYYAYNQGTLIPFTGEQIKTMNADQTVESIVNLLTLTYFADGMKDVPDYANNGKVFDEMAENKATKRVGAIDLGTLTYNYQDTRKWFSIQVTDKNIKYPSSNATIANILASIYEASSRDTLANDLTLDKKIALNNNSQIIIRDLSYTDPVAFKTAMSGKNLYFELAEPVETPIASASLVSQNQEIPMIVEDDKLVAYSTSEITEQSGFHDTKIKLSNDGVAYSAKFTMHIERKP